MIPLRFLDGRFISSMGVSLQLPLEETKREASKPDTELKALETSSKSVVLQEEVEEERRERRRSDLKISAISIQCSDSGPFCLLDIGTNP